MGKLRLSSRREKGQYRSNDVREDDVRRLTLSSRREKGQYRSNDVREDDVGELTLSSWYGMGKHPCRISRWRRDVRDVNGGEMCTRNTRTTWES